MKIDAKRLIAMLLTFAMLFTMAPVSVFAQEANEAVPAAEETGLPIYFFIAQPGTEPTPTSNFYASYPGYTQGSAKATPAASAITSDGIRNVTDETIVTQYIVESTLPNGSLADFEDFGENVSFSFGYGGTQSYNSSEYDIVWVSISQKTGYDNSASRCNCRNLQNTPHIHIDGVLSKKVSIPDEVKLTKTISEAQEEDLTFTFTLEKLVQDADFAPTSEVDPNFDAVEMTATILSGETSAPITGGEGIVGNFGYYRLTENEDPMWTASPVYIEIATNGAVKYSYDLNPNSFAPMSDGATVDNTYETYTVTYTDGLEGVVSFEDQSYTGLRYGTTTPDFVGGTPEYPGGGMFFTGWSPEIAGTVTESVTYVAQWEEVTYTVLWLDEDGTVLETDENVKNGTVPTYDGTTPTKEGNEQYFYRFAGWTPTVTAVSGADQEYTAVYTPAVNEYTVIWKDEDGTVLETDKNVPYNTFPTYDNGGGTTAELAQAKNDAQYSVRFTGWTPVPSVVKGNQEYMAVYSRTKNTYTVTWVNYNGTQLEQDTGVEYGADPSYDGATPTRPETALYTYTFTGWTPEVSPVTGNITYTAQFESALKTYTVTLKLYLDGVLTDSASVHETAIIPELRADGDNQAYVCTNIGTGTYRNEKVPNGTYRIYAPGGTEPLCSQIIVVSDADVEKACYYYSVTYDANGGENAPAGEKHHIGESVTVSETKPTRDGYIFKGWEVNDTDTALQPGASLTSNITETYILTAQWVKAVDVIVNVHIDHTAGSVVDDNPEKSQVIIELVSRTTGGTDPWLEVPGTAATLTADSHTGYTATHTPEGTGYTNTLYASNGAIYTNIEDDFKDFSLTYVKHGYVPDTSVPNTDASGIIAVKNEEEDTWTIDLYLKYAPESFELEFSVEMDKEVPQSAYPDAVIARVRHWDGDSWELIQEQAGGKPGVNVPIDPETGIGTGSYSVWQKETDAFQTPYYYRFEVSAFVYDGNIFPATTSDLIVYQDDIYTATMQDVGTDLPTASDEGAYFNGTAQTGTLKAIITVPVYQVTIDANGGTFGTDAVVVLEDLIKMPSVTGYVPTHADASHVFNGYNWYPDSDKDGKADSETAIAAIAVGTKLTDSYVLIAKWKGPITVQGAVTISGTYDLNGTETPINVADHLDHVTVLLQQDEFDSGNFVTKDSQSSTVAQYEAGADGTATFKFENLPNRGTWRILISNPYYTIVYQNESSAEFTAINNVAVLGDDNIAVVNALMRYKPENFELWYQVIATAIGEGFRPTKAEVQVLYDATAESDSPRDWAVISQMLGTNGKETTVGTETSYPVWKHHPLGYLSDYAIKVTTVDTKEVSADDPFTIEYNGSAEYADPGYAQGRNQTQLLTAILKPKTFPVRYYLEPGSTFELTNLAHTHTWSFATDVTETVPTRVNHVFAGWVDAQGNPVTLIEASVAEETKLYATWEDDFWKDADKTPEEDDQDSPTDGDGIPDSQQVHIRYVAGANGTVSPIGEIVTIEGEYFTDVTVTGSGSTATPATGYALDAWTYEGAESDPNDMAQLSLDGTKLIPSIYNADGGETYIFNASFDQDNKGDEDDGGSDEIPDKYQVFVEFRSANADQGTVTGTVRQTVTFPKGIMQGDVTPSLEGVTVTPKDGYTFDYWTRDNETAKLSDAAVETTIENVPGNTTIVFNAHFAIDEWKDDPDGDEDDGGDGIPDYKQALVKFVAAANGRGTVTGENTVQVFTLAQIQGSFTGSITPVEEGVTVTPNTGYAFDYWGDTDNFWGNGFGAEVEDPFVLHEAVNGGQIIVYTAHFWADNWKDDPDGDDDEGGDKIPDNRQILIEYFSLNEEQGTVAPALEVITLTGNGPEDVNAEGAEATAKEGFTFNRWYYTQRAGVVDYTPAQEKIAPRISGANGGEHYTFTATFSEDTLDDPTIPEPDPDEPGDGVPDEYQVVVTYKVSGGYWKDTDNADREVVFTYYEQKADGTWVLKDPLPTLGTSIPDVKDAKPDANHTTPAYWSPVPYATDVAINGAVYTYTFTEKGDVLTFTFDANGGAWEKAVDGYQMGTGNTTASIDGYFGDTVEKIPTEPTREGYTFLGWYTTKALTAQLWTQYNPTVNLHADTTVYAKWEKDPEAPTEPEKFSGTLLINLQDENGAALADVIRIAIKESYLVSRTEDQDADYVIPESITYNGKNYVYEKVASGELSGTLTRKNETKVVCLEYRLDEWEDPGKDPDPDKPGDEIPDHKQVQIRYSADSNGTVTVAEEVITITGTDFTDVTVSAKSGSEAKAKEGYALDSWNFKANEADANATAVLNQTGSAIKPTIEKADGGKSYTFLAAFAKDEMDDPGKDPNPDQPGDEIPDKYQVTVTYRVIGGYWADGTSANKQAVFTLSVYTKDADSGLWSWKPVSPAPTLGTTIPDAEKSDTHTGAWDVAITEATPVTKSVTYTYTFTPKPAATVGAVTLTKVDAEDTDTTLPKVNFDLYKADGTKVGSYTTDANGQITVTDLPGGSYYWVETRPAEGYMLDAGKKEFTVTNGQTTQMQLTNARPEVPDVFSGDHYAYIIGKPDGLVYPGTNITRAEVATIFFRMLDEETRAKYMTKTNNFGDVTEGKWYNTAVSTMAAMGIVNGDPDGNFYPNRNTTRAEFAAIAARFDKNGNTTGVSFDDIYGHWAYKEICIAANNGWVLGYVDGVFKPNQPITRAEAMAMVNRVLQRIPQSIDDLLPDMMTWPDNMNTSKWYYLTVQEATNSHDHERKENGYEYWTKLTEVPDWEALED